MLRRKWMVLAAMLAMAVLAASPALAQLGQDIGQESEAGQVDIGTTVTSGDGQEETTPQVMATEPTVAVPPPPAPVAAPPPPAPVAAPPPPAPKAAPAEAKAGAPEAKAPTPPPPPKAEAPKMEMKKEEKKELPKTGGNDSASLLGLGAGALLVGGGLLFRRISR